MNMLYKLSVIIVTYKNISIVRDCLDSIRKFNDIGDELEVIISDNSEDNALVDAISAEYDWVKIIKNRNEGFGAGNNRGYEISSGKYLLFLNPDTILVEPIFKFAIEKFEADNHLGLFGIQLIDRDGKKNCSFFSMDKHGISAKLRDKLCRMVGHYIDGKMFISGANLFVRKEAFEGSGRFDENIFMYKEEADLIKRIKLATDFKKTAFFKEKKLIHLEGGTEIGTPDKIIAALKRVLEADRYYAKKWNMCLEKIYGEKLRYNKFKLLIYKCLMKNKAADLQRKRISVINEFLEGTK